MSETFPIVPSGFRSSPLRVPWSVAEAAYSVYVQKNGKQQTLEDLARRGGFHASEMDMLYPKWREEASEIARLTAERDAARSQLAEVTARLPKDATGKPLMAGDYVYFPGGTFAMVPGVLGDGPVEVLGGSGGERVGCRRVSEGYYDPAEAAAAAREGGGRDG